MYFWRKIVTWRFHFVDSLVWLPVQNLDWNKRGNCKATAKMKSEQWVKNEIGEAVQSWLWMQVELMVWYLKALESVNKIQWSHIEIPISSTFYSYYTKSFSDEYHIER